MDENTGWAQIRVECNARDVDTVSSVMSMVDNGLMIEDNSDIDDLIKHGMYGELIDESLLEADRTKAAVSVFIPAVKSPAESELFIRGRLNDLGVSVHGQDIRSHFVQALCKLSAETTESDHCNRFRHNSSSFPHTQPIKKFPFA